MVSVDDAVHVDVSIYDAVAVRAVAVAGDRLDADVFAHDLGAEHV